MIIKNWDGEKGEEAVSELVAAIMLISLVIIGVAMVAAVFFSQPGSVAVPQMDIITGLNPALGEAYLYNNGGDSLEKGTFKILVDSGFGFVDKTSEVTLSGGGNEWSVGTALVYNYGSGDPPEGINIVYVGEGIETLISSVPFKVSVNEFVWGNITDTGRPVVTPMPTGSYGLKINNKEDIRDELKAVDGMVTIEVSTTNFVADRVDAIFYNCDDISGAWNLDDWLIFEEMEQDVSGVWELENYNDLDEIIELVSGPPPPWRPYVYDLPAKISLTVTGYNETTYESYSDSLLFTVDDQPT